MWGFTVELNTPILCMIYNLLLHICCTSILTKGFTVGKKKLDLGYMQWSYYELYFQFGEILPFICGPQLCLLSLHHQLEPCACMLRLKLSDHYQGILC